MNANDIIFQLKKIDKLIKKKEVNIAECSSKLRTIILECNDRKMKKEKNLLYNIISKLPCYADNIPSITSILSKLIKTFKVIKEKEKVMECREARARVCFFKHSPSQKKNINSDISLHCGDIVRIPSHGGMHYSIIANINKDIVECYPLTTGRKEDLDILNVKSMPISVLENGTLVDLRITSSKSLIPIRSAQQNKVGFYENTTYLNHVISCVQ